MTKVDPGPGFKGLKWKWIQDHAKEQQEREKEQQTAEVSAQEQPQTVSDSRPPGPPSAGQCSANGADAPQVSVPLEQLNGSSRAIAAVAGTLQQGAGTQLHLPVKVESGHGPPGPGPGSKPAPMSSAPAHLPDAEARRQPKVEEAGKAIGTEPTPVSASSGLQLAGGKAPLAGGCNATAQLTAPTPGLTPEPSVPGRAPASVGPSINLLATHGSGLPARKSLEPSGATLAPKVAGASSSPPPSHPAPVGGTAAAAGAQAAIAGAPATLVAAPGPAPPVQQGASNVATNITALPGSAGGQPSPAAGGHPAPAAPATASTAPLAHVGSRARLPPSRAPSLTVAATAAQGGDDFESMFTPLSSVPTVKTEALPGVGASGAVSRANSMVLGAQPSVPVAGGGSAVDAGGPQPERKVASKKAAKLQEGKGGSGQEQADAEHGHGGRSRTPVGTHSGHGSAAAVGSGRDVSSGPTGVGNAASCKAQQQAPSSQQQGPHSQSGQQQGALLQHRAPGAKQAARDGKDVPKAHEPPDAPGPSSAASPAAVAPGLQSAAAGTAIGTSAAPAGRPTGGDKDGSRPSGAAPADAGSVPGNGASDKGERKRPRSDGSKPKFVPTTTPTEADFGAPYMETLADRIKRARRTTTSSSEHEGPPSHGCSAERLPGHGNGAGGGAARNTGGAPGGGEQEGRPRPATSAEAQSRGADAVPGNASKRAAQGGGTGGAATGDSPAAGTGPGGAQAPGAKQQQSRGLSSGRADDAAALAASGPRAAPPAQDKGPGQPQSAQGLTLRTSVGGAVTDSSGGGSAPCATQRASVEPVPGSAAAARQGSARPTLVGGKRLADFSSTRRPGAPAPKLPRTDTMPPRPTAAPGVEGRAGAGNGAADGTVVAGSGSKPPASLPPPPARKLAQRSSSGPHEGKAPGKHGAADGQAPPHGAVAAAAGGAGVGHGPSPTVPPARLARLGDGDMPAAGSCKGPAGGSRGSKDGAGDKGACGPRGVGGAGGTGGPGAAATTTTEPKTDSDTRTSRVVECYFEFDELGRAAGTTATVSGLGSSGSLQAGGLHMGGVRHGGASGGVLRGCATSPPQHLDLGKVRTFKELWAQLAALYDGTLPDEMDSKLIYLDEEGDWIMVTPDEPYSSVAATAVKVLVTNRT